MSEGRDIILRVVGQNGSFGIWGGGTRVHCHQLNTFLEERGYKTVTFIPMPLFDDEYTLRSLIRFDYRHSLSPFVIGLFLFRNRRRILFLHSHLRNASVLMLLVTSILRVPHVMTVHTPLYETIPSLKDRVISFVFGLAVRRAALVIFISRFVAERVCRQANVVRSLIVAKIVYNGSDFPASSPHTGGLSGPLKICVVGELSDRKNMSDLLSIIRKLHDGGYGEKVIISVYGSGPYVGSLKDLAAEVPLLRVMGYEKDTGAIFSGQELHLILSKNEAFGRVVSEAMAHGVPTLCYRRGAFPELIEHGQSGFLSDNRDDLFEQLTSLIGDKAQISPVSKGARQVFEERFSVDAFCKATLSALQEVGLVKVGKANNG